MSTYSWNLDSNTGTTSQKAEFCKFPEGITRVRVIDQAPYQRWTHFMRAHNRSINCPGTKTCPICEIRRQEKANKMPYTHAMTKRFAINVINRETGRVEIMEQGVTFMQDIKDIMDDLQREGKSLLDVDLKVRRRGTTKDNTSYRVDIDREYPLSTQDKELIESDAIKLDEYFKDHTPEQILRILDGEAWDKVMSGGEENENKGAVSLNKDEPIGEDEEIEIS